MKKVFLSVPIDGLTKDMIMDEIRYLRNICDEYRVKYVDNFITKPPGSERLYCLGEAIKKLGECDAILIAHDWRLDRECHIELGTALIYRIPKFDLRHHDEEEAFKRWCQES